VNRAQEAGFDRHMATLPTIEVLAGARQRLGTRHAGQTSCEVTQRTGRLVAARGGESLCLLM